jgi:hypothetical protein
MSKFLWLPNHNFCELMPRTPPIGRHQLASFSVPMPQAFGSFNFDDHSYWRTPEDFFGVN